VSDLATFGAHKPGCPPRDQSRRWINCFDEHGVIADGHYDPPRCPGCVTDADRALWGRLAAEVEAYLTPEEEEALL
jgi:hypothetical protein